MSKLRKRYKSRKRTLHTNLSYSCLITHAHSYRNKNVIIEWCLCSLCLIRQAQKESSIQRFFYSHIASTCTVTYDSHTLSLSLYGLYLVGDRTTDDRSTALLTFKESQIIIIKNCKIHCKYNCNDYKKCPPSLCFPNLYDLSPSLLFYFLYIY